MSEGESPVSLKVTAVGFQGQSLSALQEVVKIDPL